MTTKSDTHATHGSSHDKPADKGAKTGNGDQPTIDSLGQANPAEDLEKKNLKEAQERASKQQQEEEHPKAAAAAEQKKAS